MKDSTQQLSDEKRAAIRQRWRDAAKKFVHAIKTPRGEFVDYVRVRIADSSEQYLEDVVLGTQTYMNPETQKNDEFKILHMSEKELAAHKLSYHRSSGRLLNNIDQVATTIGKKSKDTENSQAFIMSKEGHIYVGSHSGLSNRYSPNLTHSSFLSGRPAEMAGLISINQDGKIDFLSDNSGHYVPEALDMKRAIDKLRKEMPGVFAKDAQIEVFGQKTVSISEFDEQMEKPGVTGKSIYEELRNKRIDQFKQYEKDLKSSVCIKIDCANQDFPTALANLSLDQKRKLQTALRPKMFSISAVISKDKSKAYSIGEALLDVINSGNAEALKTLTNAGAFEREEVQKLKFLYSVVADDKKDLIKVILANPVAAKFSLEQEQVDGLSNSLHMAVQNGNSEAIALILKYPEGNKLLTLKNENGKTPLDLVRESGRSEIVEMVVKHQILEYLAEEIADKNVITTNHQKQMKERFVELLSPLYVGDKKALGDIAGNLVAEGAKIASRKLEKNSMRFEISQKVNAFFNKFRAENEKSKKLQRILEDSKSKLALENMKFNNAKNPPHQATPANRKRAQAAQQGK